MVWLVDNQQLVEESVISLVHKAYFPITKVFCSLGQQTPGYSLLRNEYFLALTTYVIKPFAILYTQSLLHRRSFSNLSKTISLKYIVDDQDRITQISLLERRVNWSTLKLTRQHSNDHMIIFNWHHYCDKRSMWQKIPDYKKSVL